MLTIWGSRQPSFCDGLSRRSFLRAGALGLGGLTMADLLRLRARGATSRPDASRKAVILIVLPGGPSHIDMYDMKPEAPAEVRGPFNPIATNVPGITWSELMPLQATIADKLAIVRGLRTQTKEHYYHEVVTGYPPRLNGIVALPSERASFGSVVSKLRGPGAGDLPAYVSLRSVSFGSLKDVEGPAFLGAGHAPFVPQGAGVENLKLAAGVTPERLGGRRDLLQSIDGFRDQVDAKGALDGMDEFNRRAFEMLGSSKVRDAFDVSREPESVRAKYGPKGQYTYYGTKLAWDPAVFLQARRLAEAGVPVVTLSVGSWDHHSPKDGIFSDLRTIVPKLDQAIHGLVTDLHERGLDKDVAVVVWGEMGRTPRINATKGGGRDHWPDAGCAVIAGGGFRTGQVIGATDRVGARATGVAYTPQNVFATLYHHLGIDPSLMLPDRTGRPLALLDDREMVGPLLA